MYIYYFKYKLLLFNSLSTVCCPSTAENMNDFHRKSSSDIYSWLRYKYSILTESHNQETNLPRKK